MNLKYFENITGEWLDITGQTGAALEYDGSGWVTSGGYKKYIAQITQSGSDAPVAIVLENTFAFTPYWEYNDAGIYGFNFEDMDINYDKLVYYLSPTHNGKVIWIDYNDVYNLTLKTQDGDSIITQTTLEIRYYN